MGRRKRNSIANSTSSQFRVWKVGKYIRLSRDDGNNESESIVNQRKILDEKIPEYFEDDYEIVDEYIDDGRTGTSDDTRPSFLRLVEDVKLGRINCIVTKNLSRAFRNSANQGKFLEEFIPLYHTRFISLYEPHIDTFLNPEIVHSLEVSITGFINEQYAYKTSQDVRRTFDTKRKKGEFIGAFAPYGYQKRSDDKNSFIIDEEAAAVVRDIYHWFVNEGMSKMGITRRLNELGIPNPSTYKRKKGLNYSNPRMYNSTGLWGVKTVREILLNEMYIGNMVQGRQKIVSYKVHTRVATEEKDWYIVKNTHEPIIDMETFEKAQRLHEKDMRVSPGKRKVYLFSGFLRCADCKQSMTRHVSKGYVYYHCTTYTRK
ncbi:MAG: recombinase family protein, partial [Anaerotignum sp.]|nr:recombinase family protein [Anaerotignum sp.]